MPNDYERSFNMPTQLEWYTSTSTTSSPLTLENIRQTREMMRQEQTPQSGTAIAILQETTLQRQRDLMRRFRQQEEHMPELIPWTEEQERMLRASDAGEVIASVNDGHVYNKPEFHILEMLATEYPSVRIVAKMEGLTAFPLRLGHTFLLLQNYVMLAENKLYCKTDDAIVIFKLVKFATWEGKRFGLILEVVDIQMDNEVRSSIMDLCQFVEEA